MKAYRSYFDHISLSAGQHRRLMDTLDTARRTPHPRRNPILKYAALAACCAFALFAGFRAAGQLGGGSVPGGSGTALPPEPVLTGSPSPVAPPEGEQQYTLVVTDPFEGRPHGNFSISGVEFTDCTDAPSMSASIVLPQGSFTEKMTAEDIIAALGGGDAVPWPLYWTGFGLTGQVIYDGQGQVWRATIRGEREEDGTTFSLMLAPDHIPVRDTVFEVDTVDFEGLEVTAWYQHYDRDKDGEKEYVYAMEFFYGAGVRFQVTAREEETASWLCDCLLSHAARTDGMFTTMHLVPEEIPEWRSEELTLEEAYAEELGAWLPAAAPEGYAFGSAHRELGQNRDWLHLSWIRGYDYVDVTVSRFPAHASIPAPDLDPDQISDEALEEWGSYVDDDAGDTPGWRYPSFTLHYPQEDGSTIAVDWRIKGLSPEEAARLVSRPARSAS